MRAIAHVLVVVVVVIVTAVITVILVRRSGACRGTTGSVESSSWLNRLLGKQGTPERDASEGSEGFLSRLGTLMRETGKRYEGPRMQTLRSPVRERRYGGTEPAIGRGLGGSRGESSSGKGHKRDDTTPKDDRHRATTRRKRGDLKTRQKKLTYEKRCRQIIEQVFGDVFPKVRPAWLRNERRDSRTGTGTGHCLELDCYNARLGVALEYNGYQHRAYPNTWHASRQEFEDQRKRDRLKVVRCAEEDVRLVVVPDTVPYDELYTYITEELERMGVIDFSD
jgi:preprotein translocase subunit SecG